MRVKTTFTVYAIRCTKTGKMYIGRSSDVRTRIKTHFNELKRGKKTGLFQSEYDEFGRDAFEFFVLEKDIPYETAGDRELFWIEEYRATDDRFGYNRSVKTGTPMVVPIEKTAPPKPEELFAQLTPKNREVVAAYIAQLLKRQRTKTSVMDKEE